MLLSFSNLFSQQLYGPQRGQRGYIPPPKFESSVYITTIDSYEELNKTLPSCVELFSLDDFEKEILSSDNKVALIGIIGSLCAVTLILILIISEKINSKIKGL